MNHVRFLATVPWMVSAVGLLVAISWIWYMPTVTHFGPLETSMKLPTAILFILSGATLLLAKIAVTTHKTSGSIRIWFWAISALSAILIVGSILAGMSSEIAYYFGLIPSLPTTDAWRWVPLTSSPVTLLSFLCSTAACGLLVWGARMPLATALLLPSFLIVAGSLAIIGNLASLPILYFESSFAGGMAVHTALLFLASGVYLFDLIKSHSVLPPSAPQTH